MEHIYVIGDLVKVKHGLCETKEYCCSDMCEMAGQVLTIQNIMDIGYIVKENGFVWVDYMLGPVLSTEEFCYALAKMCNAHNCGNCPINALKSPSGTGTACRNISIDNPHGVIQIVTKWSISHIKKKFINIVSVTPDSDTAVYYCESSEPLTVGTMVICKQFGVEMYGMVLSTKELTDEELQGETYYKHLGKCCKINNGGCV